MTFPSDLVVTRIASGALFAQLDLILLQLLRHSAPTPNYVDGVIEHVEARHGVVRMDDVASQFGKSRRQMERSFLQTVGVPLKFFCMISRLRHATDLIVQPTPRSLTAVARACPCNWSPPIQ